ncbi:major facilitator superfamily domain-containing protein [Russula compacta]|nr:major facilitator superfamily domain-containing protein [Russula compacta]
MQATTGSGNNNFSSGISEHSVATSGDEDDASSKAELPENHAAQAAAHALDQGRLEALRSIDRAGFSRFHLKVIWVVGVGFFTDAYDVFAINLTSVMLGYVYGHTTSPPDLTHRLSANQDFGIKVAAPIGNLFGQLVFGLLADIFGRKRMYGVELMIIITATFAQALSGSGPGVNIVYVLVVWRFIMGAGVGGDYPLSAVIASEFASTSSRGRLMTAVFTSQGWGNLVASLVALFAILGFKDSIIAGSFNDSQHVDYCWRVLIGLGCVPGAIALYFRLTIPETPRFTMDIDRNVQRAQADIEKVLGPDGGSTGVYWVDPDAVVQRVLTTPQSWKDFNKYLRKPGNFRLLFGVAYSWFAIDVALYGLGLNLSTILTSSLLTQAGIGDVVDPSELNTTLGIYKSLHNLVIGSIVVSVAGFLPGYYASFFFIDDWECIGEGCIGRNWIGWGRLPIQYMGFGVLTLVLAIMAGIYPGPEPDANHQGAATAFVALFCLANFFTNFGPNVTTFIIPGEIFPTRYRSTTYGFAAACGKLGAIVSQIIFFRVNHSDKALKSRNICGCHVDWHSIDFFTEGNDQQSLEELSGETQIGVIQGVPLVEIQHGVVHRLGSNTPGSSTLN